MLHSVKFIQQVKPEPDWPEFGVQLDGSPIRLADVERLLPPGDERASVYFLRKDGTKVRPWKESGYYVDEAGHVLSGAGPLPMTTQELEALGLTDDNLRAEHAAYYREALHSPRGHVDDHAAQVERRRLYDAVLLAWNEGKSRIHHGG